MVLFGPGGKFLNDSVESLKIFGVKLILTNRAQEITWIIDPGTVIYRHSKSTHKFYRKLFVLLSKILNIFFYKRSDSEVKI